jgi:hypothetical protein
MHTSVNIIKTEEVLFLLNNLETQNLWEACIDLHLELADSLEKAFDSFGL